MTILAVTVIHGGACTMSTVPPSPPQGQNNAPVIHDLKAPKQVAPSSSSQILCVASDEDDDVPSYEWSATGGQIQGEADSIIWIVPETAGDYTVTVVVTDGKGGQATSSVTVLVALEPNRPPVVHSITCDDCSGGAIRWTEYRIKCDASDPEGDELHYAWSVTFGKIEGEGPNVTWLTYGRYGDAIVKVVVTDDKGNEAEGHLAINIGCCH